MGPLRPLGRTVERWLMVGGAGEWGLSRRGRDAGGARSACAAGPTSSTVLAQRWPRPPAPLASKLNRTRLGVDWFPLASRTVYSSTSPRTPDGLCRPDTQS